MSENEIDLLIYKLYPRRIGKIAAMQAIQKAVRYLTKENHLTPIDARRMLYRAVKSYSESTEGKNPDRTKIPYPATWFNRGSYLDDPAEWGVERIKQVSVQKAAAAEAEKQREREQLLRFWREAKEDNRPIWRDAPQWIREELS